MSLRTWAQNLKRDILALWVAARDKRTPLAAKILAAAVAAYAFSPIDLIPDFLPVIGYLDDLIIIPIGVALILRMIPKTLMAEYRQKALKIDFRPNSRRAAICILLMWIGAAYWLIRALDLV
ncbi:YkvA family protein [Sphingorhabdus sp. M41]|uniref:YkvA family protein n=1 Tax=Sphingorhabdus sp. M41 TaxID=1806885 RepID=UPI001E2B8526|nr:DUF1232 domain-containing protein [Sphingorhabdus sp. M41]